MNSLGFDRPTGLERGAPDLVKSGAPVGAEGVFRSRQSAWRMRITTRCDFMRLVFAPTGREMPAQGQRRFAAQPWVPNAKQPSTLKGSEIEPLQVSGLDGVRHPGF